jgi:hypothetical protein
MKIRFLVSLLVLLLATHSFAGVGWSPEEFKDKEEGEDNSLVPYEVKSPTGDKVQILPIEKTVVHIKEEKDPVQRGLFLGFHAPYPTLGYANDLLDIEGSYRNEGGDQSVLLKGGWNVFSADKDYTNLKLGLTAYFGTEPFIGIFAELEQYLNPIISITGSLFPVKVGNPSIIGDAVVGMRMYL